MSTHPTSQNEPATDDLGLLGIRELSIGYAEDRFTPSDVLNHVIGRARGLARDLGAISLLDEDGARASAAASTVRWRSGQARGPLDGVPVTVKDSLAVRGWPSRRGTLLRREAEPELRDEPAVARLREAGAVLVAHTTMPEFAWSAVSDSPLWGPVRNARDPERTAGGSSGGAAVATALGVGALGLGSDGAGSVRIPASFNGVVGFKATYGRIPATPSGAFGRLAHIGPITRSVTDAAFALDVLAGPNAEDPDSLDAPGIGYAHAVSDADARARELRIGFGGDLGLGLVSPSVEQAVRRAVDQLRASGIEVGDLDVALPHLACEFTDVWDAILAAELSGIDRAEERLLSPGLRDALRRGRSFTAGDHLRALTDVRDEVGATYARVHAEVDVLITPTLPITAFEADRLIPEGWPRESWQSWTPLTWPANLTGQPALTVPVGHDEDGLPIGIQILARRGHDEDALVVGRALETRS